MKALCIGSGLLTKGLLIPILIEHGYHVDLMSIGGKNFNSCNEYKIKYCDIDNEFVKYKLNNTYTLRDVNISKLKEYDIITTAITFNGTCQLLKYVDKNTDINNILVCENDIRCIKSIQKVFGEKAIPVIVDRIITGDSNNIMAERFAFIGAELHNNAEKFTFITNIDSYRTYRIIKLFLVNTLHCVIAWTGCVHGHTYVYDAIQDTSIQKIIDNVSCELIKILTIEFKINEDILVDYYKNFIRRVNNKNLQDPLIRVGRNTIRKLDKDERICIPMMLAKKNKLPYTYIQHAASYAAEFSAIQAKKETFTVLNDLISYVETSK